LHAIWLFGCTLVVGCAKKADVGKLGNPSPQSRNFYNHPKDIEATFLFYAEYVKLFEAGIEDVTLYRETYDRQAYYCYLTL